MVYITFFNILYGMDARRHTVNRHIRVIVVITKHCFENSAGGREKPRFPLFNFVIIRLLHQNSIGFGKPTGKLFKCQHTVNRAGILLGLCLF